MSKFKVGDKVKFRDGNWNGYALRVTERIHVSEFMYCYRVECYCRDLEYGPLLCYAPELMLASPLIACTKGYSSICACFACTSVFGGGGPKSLDCNHNWKKYMGLTEAYNYCTLCDRKE